MVTRVAKQVTLRMAETKRFTTINESMGPFANAGPYGASYWAFRPVFSPLVNGAGNGQIVGSEIAYPLLKCKFTCTLLWNDIFTANSNNYGTVTFNFYLIATNDEYVNTQFAPFPSSTYPETGNWFYQPDGHNPTFNGNNVKVLRKWRRRVTPDQVTGTGVVIQGPQVITGSLTYRWKRKIKFEDTGIIPGTGAPNRDLALRGWNYYMVAGVRTNGVMNFSTNNNSLPLFKADSFLYYKDP